MFRLQLKLSIQANDDYNHSNKQQSTNVHVSPNNEQIEESELIEIKMRKQKVKKCNINSKKSLLFYIKNGFFLFTKRWNNTF